MAMVVDCHMVFIIVSFRSSSIDVFFHAPIYIFMKLVILLLCLFAKLLSMCFLLAYLVCINVAYQNIYI